MDRAGVNFVSTAPAPPVPCNARRHVCYVLLRLRRRAHASGVRGFRRTCPSWSSYNGFNQSLLRRSIRARTLPAISGNPIHHGQRCQAPIRNRPGEPIPLAFRRTFAVVRLWQYGGAFGRGWSSNLHSRRVRTDVISGLHGCGRSRQQPELPLLPDQRVWRPDADVADRLTELKDGNGTRTGWTYYDAATEMYGALRRERTRAHHHQSSRRDRPR